MIERNCSGEEKKNGKKNLKYLKIIKFISFVTRTVNILMFRYTYENFPYYSHLTKN